MTAGKLPKKKIILTPYLFLIPVFVLLMMFRYYAIFSAVYHSFFFWKPGLEISFVGLENYTQVFKDKIFWISMVNILKYTAARILVLIPLAFIGAELVFNLKTERGQYIWKVIYILPLVIPWVVLFLYWKFFFNPQIGILNKFLIAIGWEELTHAWLGEHETALWCLVFYRFPYVSTLFFLILISKLQDIPTSVLEASKLDGASTWKRILHMDIPMIMGAIRLCIILLIMANMRVFAFFFIMTGGGPGAATEVPGLYIFKTAFHYMRFGYACALGIILLLVILFLTYINIKFIKSRV